APRHLPMVLVHAGDRLDVATESGPKLSLTLDGKLGLGVIAPAAHLELNDGADGSIRLGPDLTFDGGNDGIFFFSNVGAASGHSSVVSGAERLSVLNNGNVGIGTNPPRTLLEIKKAIPRVLGPILRLTGGGGGGAQAAFDFATYDPGTDEPAGRIV